MEKCNLFDIFICHQSRCQRRKTGVRVAIRPDQKMDFALAEFELRIKQRNRSRSKRLAVLAAAFVRTPDTNSDGAIVAKILVAIIEHDILIE